MSYEEMLELFCQYGRNCDVIMIPQKSYAFVCYKSVEESEAACTHLNGHKLPVTNHRKNEVVLYTFFVSEGMLLLLTRLSDGKSWLLEF